MNCKELEITNVMITCDKKTDKHKETLSAYGIKGKEKTSSTQEKKKKHVMVMFVCMNAENTYFIQCINVSAQHKRRLSIKRKRLLICTIMR